MKMRTLALGLLLAACSRQPQPSALDRLDNELTDANSSGQRDPALKAALAGQIMVDPALAQQNGNPVRPPDRLAAGEVPTDIARDDPVDAKTLKHAPAPTAGATPQSRAADGALTLGALAGRQPDARTSSCAAGIAYSARWAARLPAALPLYPDARVSEAAGNTANGCSLHVVSFVSSAGPDKMVDWYYNHASLAGYSAEHQLAGGRHVLGGTHGEDAYVVYVTPRQGGGSSVDLVTNTGS